MLSVLRGLLGRLRLGRSSRTVAVGSRRSWMSCRFHRFITVNHRIEITLYGRQIWVRQCNNILCGLNTHRHPSVADLGDPGLLRRSAETSYCSPYCHPGQWRIQYSSAELRLNSPVHHRRYCCYCCSRAADSVWWSSHGYLQRMVMKRDSNSSGWWHPTSRSPVRYLCTWTAKIKETQKEHFNAITMGGVLHNGFFLSFPYSLCFKWSAITYTHPSITQQSPHFE